MKECFKCHIVKPLTEFYKHKGMADGHLNKCKDCNKKDTVNNYVKNRDYYIAYDKARAKTKRRKAWRYQDTKKWRAENPEAYAAHGAVARALKSGKLTKEPCHCGETKVEAHHPDYEQKLFVIWLCNKHHKHIHERTAL